MWIGIKGAVEFLKIIEIRKDSNIREYGRW